MKETTNDFELRVKTPNPSEQTEDAVYLRGAHKQYGSRTSPVIVLDGLNMTVPKGCIYGLLGASGCGKTTLLNCIVGRSQLNSGGIWVLGGKPGSRSSGAPGPRIGFMPQDIGLLDLFTIQETFIYFGWINGMTSKEVENKTDFYIKFLVLPDANHQVGTLSGGQQRRVSLAVTLIHEPELLILDEPTVGVDPLLRIKIWDHLLEITKKENRTVILTTHYIEETKNANLLGLMRGGCLLAEESPEYLITQYNAVNLENVFLKLSIKQNLTKNMQGTLCAASQSTNACTLESGLINKSIVDDNNDKLAAQATSMVGKPLKDIPESNMEPEEKSRMNSTYFVNGNHIKALIWKYFLWMWRNIPMVSLILVLPLGQMILFGLSIGRDPKEISLSVVNNELNPDEDCKSMMGCNSTRLSCNYFELITKKYSMNLEYFDNEQDARQMVKKGKSWAVLIVHQNFSHALQKRVGNILTVNDDDLFASTISVFQDQSNIHIGNYVSNSLRTGFLDFLKSYLISCNENPALGNIPVRMNKPIYGANQPDYRDFMAPGITLCVTFFMGVVLAYGLLLSEFNDGILERAFINGITTFQLLFSQSISCFVVMLFQTIFICIPIVAFGIKQEGNWLLIIALTLLCGICGIFYGFFVTCISSSEQGASYIALGSFVPILAACGIYCPIETTNRYLKLITVWLPLTKPIDSLRCIMARGCGISNSIVYNGFVMVIGWSVVFATTSLILLIFKKR